LSFGELKSTKTRRNRSVPIIGALRLDLAAWKLASGKEQILLFPNSNGGPWDEGQYRRWRRFTFKPALRDAGLPDEIRPYDLRHARASMLMASGVGIVEAAAQLGHAPTVLLDTYAHVLEGSDGRLDVDREIGSARDRLLRSPTSVTG
jgi:integrase